MADIAAHLGISRQLVSIVLRDMPGASQETRKRVRDAAAALGYSPHMAARTLRQYRSRHIGVAFTPADATESEIVEAIYRRRAAWVPGGPQRADHNPEHEAGRGRAHRVPLRRPHRDLT